MSDESPFESVPNPYSPPRAAYAPIDDLPSVSVEELAASYPASRVLIRRWAACWIDLVGSSCFLLIPDAAFGNEVYQGTMLIWLLLAAGYFIVPEILWGQTLGKRIVGVIVLDSQGHLPVFGQVMARTLFRLIEVNPLCMGGAVAGICVLLTKKRQRLGDLVAGTYVVLKKDRPRIRRNEPNVLTPGT